MNHFRCTTVANRIATLSTWPPISVTQARRPPRITAPPRQLLTQGASLSYRALKTWGSPLIFCISLRETPLAANKNGMKHRVTV